jgi:hypothetical protein
VWRIDGRRPLGRLRLRWNDSIKMDLGRGVGAWTGFLWPRIGTEGGRLQMR